MLKRPGENIALPHIFTLALLENWHLLSSFPCLNFLDAMLSSNNHDFYISNYFSFSLWSAMYWTISVLPKRAAWWRGVHLFPSGAMRLAPCWWKVFTLSSCPRLTASRKDFCIPCVAPETSVSVPWELCERGKRQEAFVPCFQYGKAWEQGYLRLLLISLTKFNGTYTKYNITQWLQKFVIGAGVWNSRKI